MHCITTRLNNLNQQLMIISKLQKMEEDFNIYPYLRCKKCDKQKNNFGHLCHCAHHILSLDDQCNRFNNVQESISCENIKRKTQCNAKTCKTRKQLPVCKETSSNKVQTDLTNDAQKFIAVNTINKHYIVNNTMDTHEEKSEQSVPIKEENFHVKTNMNTSITHIMKSKATSSKEKIHEKEDKISQEISDLRDIYSTENLPVKDDKIFERIQKDLLNEKKYTKELEKKLQSLTCSINCLKEDSEQKAACLKNALETAEEQAKLAMDLVKQSTHQVDLVRTDRDDLLSEISKLQNQIAEITIKYVALTKERDNLKHKLDSLSEDESKRCEEVQLEVNKMRCALKEKEDGLNKERIEFKGMISELTNVIKIQKRRICKITDICNNQQCLLHEKDKELSQKYTELSKIQDTLKSSNNVNKEMLEQIGHLKHCLCEETKAYQCIKQEVEILNENHSSELRIKEKIVEEQNKTITRQKKLLYDSEKMTQQVANEFNQFREELCQEKEKCKCLQIELDKSNSKLNKAYSLECEKCETLRSEINYLKNEKQKALTIAKFAYQKLNQSVKKYQKQLIDQKEQHRCMKLIIDRKEHEISCLKTQMFQNSSRSIEKLNNYVM